MIKVGLQFFIIIVFILGVAVSSSVQAKQSGEIKHTEQQLSTAQKNKDWSGASEISFKLARQYWQQKDADQAIKHLDQCISYSRKADNLPQMLLAYQQLGLIYTDINNYSRALTNYQKSLKLAQDLNKPASVNESLLKIAMSYQALDKTKKSIDPLEEALSLSLRQNDLPLQERCYQLLAESYQELGKEDKALEYMNLLALVQSQQVEKQTEKQLVQTKDALQNTQKSLVKTETSLQEAHKVNEMRQLEIDLLSKDKELAELQIKEQNARIEYAALIRNSSIAAFLGAIALISLMVKNHRKAREANREIEKQNKNISSSINYARRIQEAMLPTTEQQKERLPNSFVLFKPRDTVSGDFYLLSQINSPGSSDVVIAAADCTGHGVPGAFMSLIGMNALNGIISRGTTETNLILEALDHEIRTSLQQETSGNNDGMDIALCIYRKEKGVLEFSGAKNPLVYVQNGELFQIKGDSLAIGGRRGKKERSYKQHSLSIDKPTMVYLFSDGYRDQFGDQERGKFMIKRFNQLLLDIHQLPLEQQQQALLQTFEEWKGSTHQIDDVLVMGIKLEPLS